MKVHNYKYQTKQWMPEHESNLYDFGARIYDPVLARFTTTDPLQQFNNPYMAMGGNPVSMIDPSGMWSTNSFDNNIAAAQEKAMFGRKSSAPSGLSKIIVDGLQINSPSSGFLSNIASQTMQTGASITEPGQVAFTWSSLQTFNPEKKGEKLTLSTWGSTHSLQKAEWKFSDAAMGASYKQTAEFRQTTGNIYTLGSEVEVDGNDADAQSGGGDSWSSNGGTMVGMFMMWATGYRMLFGYGSYFKDDAVANSFRNAPGIIQARENYYKTGKTSGSAPFGASGYWNAKGDPIETFVGTFDYQISKINNTLQFTITNRTSMSSFIPHPQGFYIWPESWNPTSGPFSNFNQTYIFTEPIRK